ncbi:MAG TPA: DUF6624 domain-containing protein [Gemmatimonadaceae bacterium]|jgi:hypothetical protein|nr:DUF6624 domain-containing protein [Gemmatimonadaceae bacterium]
MSVRVLMATAVLVAGAACHARPPDHAWPTTASCIDTTGAWWTVLQQWGASESLHQWRNDSLRTVLRAMADTDQGVRNAWIAKQQDSALARRMHVVDSVNAVRIRAILANDGWPTRTLVGARGESAAWLIVQHGDDSLQHMGLRLLAQAADSEVNPTEVAMLEDRVRMHDHRPQRFGSQLSERTDGNLELYLLDDPEHVEERRARVGLPPLKEYECQIEATYHRRVVSVY